MNKVTQKTIDEFESIAIEAAKVANEMLAMDSDTKDQNHITSFDVFVERGKLWAFCDNIHGTRFQHHIPVDYLYNNDWKEGYAESLIPESEKQTDDLLKKKTALQESEELTVRERIRKVSGD